MLVLQLLWPSIYQKKKKKEKRKSPNKAPLITAHGFWKQSQGWA